jgi:hypothetical protein
MKTRTIILLFFGIFLLALLLSGCSEPEIQEIHHTLQDGRTVVCLHYDVEDGFSCDWLTAMVMP